METNMQMFSISLSVQSPCIKKYTYDDTSYVRGKNRLHPMQLSHLENTHKMVSQYEYTAPSSLIE